MAYDDSNSEKAGSQSIVADDVEPGQSEHQTQQSSPAVVSQKKECGEHEQYPEMKEVKRKRLDRAKRVNDRKKKGE